MSRFAGAKTFEVRTEATGDFAEHHLLAMENLSAREFSVVDWQGTYSSP